jgi:hypothetical protein
MRTENGQYQYSQKANLHGLYQQVNNMMLIVLENGDLDEQLIDKLINLCISLNIYLPI